MLSGRLAALAAGVITIVVPLAAQSPARARSTRVLDTVPPLIILVGDRRARLGVTVNMQAAASDELGALIESVTPNGPADRAGIRSGDVIVRFGGTRLTGAPTAAESGPRWSRSSLPGLRLIELASRLDPHDTVLVELSRDGTVRTVTVASEPWTSAITSWRTPDGGWVFQTDSMRVEFDQGQHEEFRRRVLDSPLQNLRLGRLPGDDWAMTPFYLPSPLVDLELAPLNPDLGAYFGTLDGVLVINAPGRSTLGLRGGDVVLAVDGRRSESPAHLHRILRSYRPDEAITLTIMRNQRRQDVVGTLFPPEP